MNAASCTHPAAVIRIAPGERARKRGRWRQARRARPRRRNRSASDPQKAATALARSNVSPVRSAVGVAPWNTGAVDQSCRASSLTMSGSTGRISSVMVPSRSVWGGAADGAVWIAELFDACRDGDDPGDRRAGVRGGGEPVRVLRPLLERGVGARRKRQPLRYAHLRDQIREDAKIAVVTRQLGADEGVERNAPAPRGPSDLRAQRLGPIVVAGELPAIEEVDLRRPVLVEGVRGAQASLVIGRELAHPRARVVEVVLREEAFESDVAGKDA